MQVAERARRTVAHSADTRRPRAGGAPVTLTNFNTGSGGGTPDFSLIRPTVREPNTPARYVFVGGAIVAVVGGILTVIPLTSWAGGWILGTGIAIMAGAGIGMAR